MKQRTILKEVSINGISLHSAAKVTLTLKPAPENTGIVFRRKDIYAKPEIRPHISLISTDLVRNTSVAEGHVKLHTIEHIVSALNGMNVDNCYIEMDADEPPILDGSAKLFVKLIQDAQPVEQEAEREEFSLVEPITISDGNRSIIALPHDGLKITCTSTDDRGSHTQHLSIDIDPETYQSGIALARTFAVYEDIEPLLKMGKIQGGSLNSAVVIKGDKILSEEPLRYKDEFVRHKILDIVGDIALLGVKLNAHIIAVRTGHALNAKLTAKIFEQMQAQKKVSKKSKSKPVETPKLFTEATLDSRRVLELLPHRYPFLLVDKIVDMEPGKSAKGIKCVSANEMQFMGHFPQMHVMPGVLIIEALAQTGACAILCEEENKGKIAFFGGIKNARFRRQVVPGDVLELSCEIISRRGPVGIGKACATVDGKIAVTAELTFAIQ